MAYYLLNRKRLNKKKKSKGREKSAKEGLREWGEEYYGIRKVKE